MKIAVWLILFRTENIDLVISKLAELKIPHTDKKLGCDGTFRIWLKDPDGYSFEVHQYTKDSSPVYE